MAGTTRYIFGEWVDDKIPLSASGVMSICEKGEKYRKQIAEYPLYKIIHLLEKVGRKWTDTNYAPRKEMQQLLPEETGFSSEMIALGLDELKNLFSADFLQKKIDIEFKGVPRTNFSFNSYTKTILRWHPLGMVLHVLSGNVFLVAAISVIEGLLTGNVNIFKMSSAENLFLPKLIESFIECDDDGVVSRAMAVVDYSSSQTDVIDEFKKRVDAIIIWGGEEAVKAYRNNVPARTKLIVFGPKLSLALMTKDGISQNDMPLVAEKLAREIAIWDQNACTAPQVCYVEGMEEARHLASELARALENVSISLPSGKVEFQNAVEIRKIRSVFEIAQTRDDGMLWESPQNLDWTVVLDRDQTIEASPLHRTIRVIPYHNIEEVFTNVESLRGYIQTVGIVASDEQQFTMTSRLTASGALRVVKLGEMGGGAIDEPHDGSYDLPQLMNLVSNIVHTPADDIHPIDMLPKQERADLINERLRRLIHKARLSEFYRQRLDNLRLTSVDDLEKIPILTREELEKNMPPYGTGLCTGPWFGGYVARSGGSTGEPKFSIHDAHDWDQMIGNAVKLMTAAGLKETDRVANCFLAGDLYGSFVSFDHINSCIGLTTFAFANRVIPEVFLKLWRTFRINVIEGVPATILPLLRTLKKMEGSFTMEKMIYAGAPLSETDYEWLKSELKIERIASIIGTNDAGQIAFQCREMRGHIHHTVDDFNYIEVLDETGHRVQDGQPGRIIITSLLKYAFPLIRYDIGDRGRIISETCKCGRTARVFEYLGRTDDSIAVGVLNLRYRDFKVALNEFYFSEMQIAAKTEEGREYIVVRIESDIQTEELKDKMYHAILERVEKMKQQLEDKNLSKIEIAFYAPGTLPRNPRTGKLKEIVDERV